MHLTYLAVYTHLVDIEAGLILYLKKSNLSLPIPSPTGNWCTSYEKKFFNQRYVMINSTST